SEDLEWECSYRLAHRGGPELISKSGEKQRCRLTGDSSDRDESTGGDSSEGGPKHYGDRRPPLRVAEGERGFPKRVGNDEQHLFGRARYQRDHHRTQRNSAGEGRKVAYWFDPQLPGNNSHPDPWKSVQHIGKKPNCV